MISQKFTFYCKNDIGINGQNEEKYGKDQSSDLQLGLVMLKCLYMFWVENSIERHDSLPDFSFFQFFDMYTWFLVHKF